MEDKKKITFKQVFFGDIKSGGLMIFRLLSLAFWSWLIFQFTTVILLWVLSINGILLGEPTFAYEMMLKNKGYLQIISYAIAILYFVTRIPVYRDGTISEVIKEGLKDGKSKK